MSFIVCSPVLLKYPCDKIQVNPELASGSQRPRHAVVLGVGLFAINKEGGLFDDRAADDRSI